MAIALLMVGAAVPGVVRAWDGAGEGSRFAAFDAMVREAHERSVREERAYVLVWGKEGVVRLRPEAPADRREAEGLRLWKVSKGEELTLELPAALPAKGSAPDAIWTFWPDGVCEPARLRYRSDHEAWTADYDPFSAQAEVTHD